MKIPKIKAPRFAWSAQHQRDREYGHFILRVFGAAQYNDEKLVEVLELHWQSNNSKPTDWYGFRMKSEFSQYDGDLIGQASRFASMVKKLLHEGRPLSPIEASDRLAGPLKIPRVAYDNRLNSYVTEEQRPHPDLHRYIDDYRSTGNTSCTVAALAFDEQQAKHEIAAAFGEMARNDYYRAKMKEWLDAGEPVMRVHQDGPADFFDLLPIITPPAEELPAAA